MVPRRRCENRARRPHRHAWERNPTTNRWKRRAADNHRIQPGQVLGRQTHRLDSVARRVLPGLWDKSSNRPAESRSSPPRVRSHPGAGAAVRLVPRGGVNAEDPRFAYPPASGEGRGGGRGGRLITIETSRGRCSAAKRIVESLIRGPFRTRAPRRRPASGAPKAAMPAA